MTWMPSGRMFQLVAEKGYFVQSFQKVEPGRTVRFTLYPASRICAATASQVFLCQFSSTEMISNSKPSWPASFIIAFDFSTSRSMPGISAQSGWIGAT